MRFSVASALAALPLLVSADGPQYQAQFQNYLDKVSGYIPSYSGTDPVGAAEAKAGSMNMHVLTLKNWKETLYSVVQPGSTTPEDFWLFTTGGNKTCFGRCDHIEKVFNQTAAQFALMPDAPPVGYLDCEKEPVLCNTWSIPTGVVWVFEMLPEPAEVEIWTKRFNTTTATPDDIISAYKDGYKKHFKLHEGAFHPWKGWFAKNHLALPVGWVLFVFNMFPSWMLMLVISFVSRTFMTNRMQNQMGGGVQHGGPRPAATGQAVPR